MVRYSVEATISNLLTWEYRYRVLKDIRCREKEAYSYFREESEENDNITQLSASIARLNLGTVWEILLKVLKYT